MELHDDLRPPQPLTKISDILTVETGKRLLKVVDYGLQQGVGEPVPGQMCVEAAVCYALGLEHGDDPKCVAEIVREAKITLNDHGGWYAQFGDDATTERAKALRRVAVAQLGSAGKIDSVKFARHIASAVGELVKSGDVADDHCSLFLPDEHSKVKPKAIRKLGQAREAVRDCMDAYVESGDTLYKLADILLDALRAVKAPGVALLDKIEASGEVAQ